MLNVIGRTIVGFISSFGGLFMGYNYLTGLDKSNNLLLLASSIPLTFFGIFLIYKAGRFDLDKAKMEKIIKPVVDAAGVDRIEDSGKMVKDWIKSTETADKLKVLGMEANAREEAESKM